MKFTFPLLISDNLGGKLFLFAFSEKLPSSVSIFFDNWLSSNILSSLFFDAINEFVSRVSLFPLNIFLTKSLSFLLSFIMFYISTKQ